MCQRDRPHHKSHEEDTLRKLQIIGLTVGIAMRRRRVSTQSLRSSGVTPIPKRKHSILCISRMPRDHWPTNGVAVVSRIRRHPTGRRRDLSTKSVGAVLAAADAPGFPVRPADVVVSACRGGTLREEQVRVRRLSMRRGDHPVSRASFLYRTLTSSPGRPCRLPTTLTKATSAWPGMN